jgi:uncharacterized cupredoxin-like copper-binding protein
MRQVGLVIVLGFALAASASAAPKSSAAVKPVPAHRANLRLDAHAKAASIKVTAGKPSELSFKLSRRSSVPAGRITFKVTDLGVAFHNFKICVKPASKPASIPNSCKGKATRILKHGQSATLTVSISRKGVYEFLCTVPGHAAAGMKGLLGIGVRVTSAEERAAAHSSSGSTDASGTTTPQETTPTPATSAPTTTMPPPSSGGAGNANATGCPPGVTIPTSGSADADGDELGTEPDDNDGCV